MYSSNDYKQLCKACDNLNEDGIRTWYTQLSIVYGPGMLNHQLDSVGYLVNICIKK